MNAVLPETTLALLPDQASADARTALTDAIELACSRIAPTWPLDRFIAVNPHWGWVGQPIDRAAAHLALLCGTRLTMPRTWFCAQWQARHFELCHLEAIAARHGDQPDTAALVGALLENRPATTPLPLLTQLAEQAHELPGTGWSAVVTHQISQHCAAWFDTEQARWQIDRNGGLYASWRRQLGSDHGLPWRRSRHTPAARVAALPADAAALIPAALDALGLPSVAQADYLSALLLSINGWAAWCAYLRWQARLDGASADAAPPLVELLAIRLAWEWLLLDELRNDLHTPLADWRDAWAQLGPRIAQDMEAQRIDWLLQQAIELAYQQPLCDGLLAMPEQPSGTIAAPTAPVNIAAAAATPTSSAVVAQAVFCIDVRSEPMRRALERADAAIQTRGFAGFFGLPIAYAPAGSALLRPQLPGLLAPGPVASERPDAAAGTDGAPFNDALRRTRQRTLGWRQRWADLRKSAVSGFSFVETCGLGYLPKLLEDSLPQQATPARWEDTGLPAAASGKRPQLPKALLESPEGAALARGILEAMGLAGEPIAPLLLLIGHGSQSANNPHAAGLDCGACGGQSGEVNARVLADLLNTPAVRAGLVAQGLQIPTATHVVAGLHNTTTDQIMLFDADEVPAPLQAELARVRTALAAAGMQARAERAPALGLASVADQPDALAAALRERGNDWAQVRPEWGLADNAAFIVAPRARTRHLNLNGRSFLHDYDWQSDAMRGFKTLELIMTAPMVVAHWINLQYHASTVDNLRFGSGNKVLHNVVGGHIGVFEGNGGDLRIGLPLQSLHDGQRLRHTPLRLSVFIEAPRAAIDDVLDRHALVRDLVDHGWLHLLRIDGDASMIEQRRDGGWHDSNGVTPTLV